MRLLTFGDEHLSTDDALFDRWIDVTSDENGDYYISLLQNSSHRGGLVCYSQ